MSGSMSRNKGAKWERACRKYLARWLHNYTHPGTDEPDMIIEIGGFRIAVECKDQKTMQLPAWHRQLEAEVRQAEADAGVLLIKRNGKTMVNNAWVVMSADDFTWWLQQIEHLRSEIRYLLVDDEEDDQGE
jgi:hypothetical protein